MLLRVPCQFLLIEIIIADVRNVNAQTDDEVKEEIKNNSKHTIIKMK